MSRDDTSSLQNTMVPPRHHAACSLPRRPPSPGRKLPIAPGPQPVRHNSPPNTDAGPSGSPQPLTSSISMASSAILDKGKMMEGPDSLGTARVESGAKRRAVSASSESFPAVTQVENLSTQAAKSIRGNLQGRTRHAAVVPLGGGPLRSTTLRAKFWNLNRSRTEKKGSRS